MRAEIEGALARELGLPVSLEKPRDLKFGDYTVNVFPLAKKLGENPRGVAQRVEKTLLELPEVESVEVVGGFVNLRLNTRELFLQIGKILVDPKGFYSLNLGKGKRILYEFVSANPTGPLNVVSARAAALGDSMVRVARRCGFDAGAEYYVNDAGGQIRALGETIAYHLGLREDFPPDGYRGDYVREIAQRLTGVPREELGRRAAEVILGWIKKDLEDLGVRFDSWVRESGIREKHEWREGEDFRERAREILIGKGTPEEDLYFKDGALWFKASKHGDTQDRVIVRSNGEPTYLFWDALYHLDKAERGWEEFVNLLGPDHHVYATKTLPALLKPLGLSERLRVKIVQQVHLVKGGQRLKMSKRAGQFYTLRELLEEVGRDALRFFMVLRSSSAPLEFDIDLAKTLGRENPVYYVQYVHARTCSLLDFGRERGVKPQVRPEKLSLPAERALALKLLHLLDTLEAACKHEEPHFLAHALLDLASDFHSYYQATRIITDDPELSSARLALAAAVGAAIKEGLGLLGVSAPERM